MKLLKQTSLILGLCCASALSAQSANMRNILKVGVTGGVALPHENASAAAGVNIAYQNLGVPGIGWGIATGYTHYFGRNNEGLDNNDFGVIPVALLFRYYPKQTGLYLGADVGYGVITGAKNVAKGSPIERPEGGFYINPEIGFHNQNWNFGIHYQKTFTGSKGDIGAQNYSAGNLGATISYNIPLGK